MRFIAYITGGFYFSVDENLEICSILDRRLFYYYNVNSSTATSHQNQRSSAEQQTSPDLNKIEKEDSNHNHFNNSCEDTNENEESRENFNRRADMNLIKNSDKISLSNRSKIMKKLAQRASSSSSGGELLNGDIWSLFAGDAALNEQMFEFKCIQKYELSQRASSMNLLQIVRIRAHEGFYLVRITHELVRPTKNSR